MGSKILVIAAIAALLAVPATTAVDASEPTGEITTLKLPCGSGTVGQRVDCAGQTTIGTGIWALEVACDLFGGCTLISSAQASQLGEPDLILYVVCGSGTVGQRVDCAGQTVIGVGIYYLEYACDLFGGCDTLGNLASASNIYIPRYPCLPLGTVGQTIDCAGREALGAGIGTLEYVCELFGGCDYIAFVSLAGSSAVQDDILDAAICCHPCHAYPSTVGGTIDCAGALVLGIGIDTLEDVCDLFGGCDYVSATQVKFIPPCTTGTVGQRVDCAGVLVVGTGIDTLEDVCDLFGGCVALATVGATDSMAFAIPPVCWDYPNTVGGKVDCAGALVIGAGIDTLEDACDLFGGCDYVTYVS